MSDETEKQTVLVVDDEPANIHALGALLKDEYRVQVANSGDKALGIVQDKTRSLPDMILLDIQMPGIDGYEVCRHLKDDPRTEAIVVIFVTARNAMSDEEHGLRLGAADYVSKPISPAIVRARVDTHMNLKRKTDMLERLALLDGLTGIHNRRYLDEQLEREVNRAYRDELSLSVIMIDIDHFKPFNDNYGHGEGDQCLKRITQALTGALLRPGDTLCRYGGEEFTALLPDTDSIGVQRVAHRLRERVESLVIPHEYSSVSGVVTISLGTASIESHEARETTGETLLKRADDALYAAKHAGRNRVA